VGLRASAGDPATLPRDPEANRANAELEH